MSVVHDLHCQACPWEGRERVNPPDYPDCPLCGGGTTWTPSGFMTDVFGSEQHSDAAGRSFTSQREKEAYMRAQGYEVAGDRVHGGRPEHSIRGTIFSDGGRRG